MYRNLFFFVSFERFQNLVKDPQWQFIFAIKHNNITIVIFKFSKTF